MSQSRTAANDARVVIQFEGESRSFHPHDFLSCEYTVSFEPDQSLQVIESSVIWITEGKGEEDIGVHFFERRNRNALNSETFAAPQRLSTVLPASPLSYEGTILKIRWCVRIRLFFGGGREATFDEWFELKSTTPAESDS